MLTTVTQTALIHRMRRRRATGRVLAVCLDPNTLRPIAVSTPYRKPGSLWSLGYHTGADHPAPIGSYAVAVTRGTVIHAGFNAPWGSAYGLLVVIRTAGGHYDYGYAHLSRANVKAGDKVVPGQVIGLTGATGNVTGPHLHFEARTAGGRLADNIRPIRVKQLHNRKANQK